jgi:hypothetical protein
MTLICTWKVSIASVPVDSDIPGSTDVCVLVVADELYFMSRDLAHFVVEEATKNKCAYCVGLEGHDISTMAFLSPHPVNLVVIGRHQEFWTTVSHVPGDFNSTNGTSTAGLDAARQSVLGTYAGLVDTPSLNVAEAPTLLKSSGIRSITARMHHRKRPRILVGIFSTTSPKSRTMRERIRTIFRLRNDNRVCDFWDFHKMPQAARLASSCELIYAFVMGASTQSNDTDFPNEIVGNDDRPLSVNITSFDENNDIIFLNIHENMNFGKSQTWLNFAGQAADDNEIEYVAKCDEDAILNLTAYFRFASDHLPPAPYNKGFLGGRPRNKAHWIRRQYNEYRRNRINLGFIGFLDKNRSKSRRPRHESFFDQNFNQVHIYMGGTFW